MQPEKVDRIHSVFLQFGFKKFGETSTQFYGNCPFCGDKAHFYVARASENSTWNCKKCGMGGGYKTFIDEIIKLSERSFTKVTSSILCESRGLTYETFKKARVGYHMLSGQYLVPVYGEDGAFLTAKVFNLEQKTFRAIAGQYLFMHTPMQNTIIQNASKIYVCEGEWDTLALVEMFTLLKIKDSYAIGAPSAGTFKLEALPAFEGKDVFLLYDNDKAGQDGSVRAAKLLRNVRTLKKINWTSAYPEGFDIRDLYVKKHKRSAQGAFKELETLFVKSTEETAVPTKQEFTEDPLPVDQVYRVFRKWLHLPSTEILDVVFGVAISNRIPGDPCWMFIVAPPGATKTEPLLTFTGSPLVETVSTLTSCTLISGAGLNNSTGFDPSLIPKLRNKILVIKDYTALLGLPSMEFDEITTVFRDAFDGECKKVFGNGVVRAYKDCHFTILAAVTPIIEEFTESHPMAGERFLRWNNIISEDPDKRRVFISRALGNVSKEKEMREEMKKIAHRVLISNYGNLPVIGDVIKEKIISLSQLVALLRANPSRDKYSKEIMHKSFYELGTRISKQLYKLMYGVALFRGKKEVSEAEFNVAVHVARSSVTQRVYDAIIVIYNMEECTTMELSENLRLPSVTCRIITENLYTLGVLLKEKGDDGKKILWSIKPNILKMIEETSYCRKEMKYANKNKPE